MSDPVQSYLDNLFDRLAGTGSAGRRALAEAEDHLTTAVARHQREGLTEDQAQREAVQRFGDPGQFAAGMANVHNGLSTLVRQLIAGSWLLGAIGFIAIGVSGLVAQLLGRMLGAHFVAGDATGVTYTPERCGDYLRLFPHAGSCAAAAELHHWGEVVDYRVAVGVLGLLALAVYLLARRFGPMRGQRWRPAPGPFALVATALFGLAAVVLLGPSGLQWALGDPSGVGAQLSGGVVAAIIAVWMATAAVRQRLHRPAA